VSVDLAGQLAIVTGASSGIGRALALALAKEGMALRLLGRDPTRLDATASEARARSPTVAWDSIDLTQFDQIQSFVDRVGGKRPAVLVHSAGLYTSGAHSERRPEEYATLFAANVSGPMYLTQLLLGSLASAQGQIVFINSTQGLTPSPKVGLYAATQHAFKAMADTLRDEVNPLGIRVLTVHPGRTATVRQERIFAQEGRAYTPDRLLQPEDVATMVVAALKLPRTAEVTNLVIRPMLKS
jgi:NADP-dependent 3-hydroxy acid dehydrogenase YdfG